jgi:hypothetical protein
MATQGTVPQLHPDEVEDLTADVRQRINDAPAGEARALSGTDVEAHDIGDEQYTDSTTGKQLSVKGGLSGAVDKGNANTIYVDPDQVDKPGLVAHEGWHLVQGQLAPGVRAKIPAGSTDPAKEYDYGDADALNAHRAAGGTLYTLPAEQQSRLVETINNMQHSPDPNYAALEKTLAPYIDDMRHPQLSVIQPTNPEHVKAGVAGVIQGARNAVRSSSIPLSSIAVPAEKPSDNTINTKPRAPLAPPDDVPGMAGFYLHPGNGLIPRSSAEKYMDKAGNDPAKARTMALHDGHQTSPRDEFMAVPHAKGLVEKGNIPIWNRPSVKNFDGSHSSELSMSFTDEKGHEVLVPTVVNGKFLTPDGQIPKTYKDPNSPEMKALGKAAWANYQKTGQHLGKFDNPDHADAYAGSLHSRGEKKGRQ